MKIRITFLFLIVSGWLGAQNYLGVGYFQSIPVGDYASTNSNEAGFAEPGWGLMLEHTSAIRNLPDGFSLGFHFSYQKNGINTGALEAVLDEAIVGDFYTRAYSGGYHPLMVTLGPFYDWHLTDDFSIDFKTGLGVMFANLDPIFFEIRENATGDVAYSDYVNFISTASFVYLVGMDFTYTLNDFWSISLFGNYSGARKEFDAFLNNLPTNTVTSKFSFNYVNAGLKMHVAL